MSDDITPVSATGDTVTLKVEDYNRLIRMFETASKNEVPSTLSDETAFRTIGGEVYEIHHDSRGNPYLKRRGVLVDHE